MLKISFIDSARQRRLIAEGKLIPPWFRLEDFERFVFVMSALEHSSEHDCAVFLECSVQKFGKLVVVLSSN